MAWTAPRTWTTSLLVTAAQLNVDIRDNTGFLRAFHGARMWQSAAENQTSSGSWQQIQWDTTDFDTDSFAVLGSEWFVVPTGFGGYYRVQTHVMYSGNATGLLRQVKIAKNETYTTRTPNGVGTSLSFTNFHQAGAGAAVSAPAQWTGPLVAGDHISIEGLQNSGGTLALNVGKDNVWAEIHYLGS